MIKSISTLALCIILTSLSIAQNAPVDFETTGHGADWNWRTFENLTNPELEIVTNPDSSGINISSTVAKFTALQAGQPFAGCESLHGADIGDFVIDSDNSIIRIMVWKSVISDVGIKLVRADNYSLGEIKIPNTLTNEWEQLEFDFSDHLGNPYDQIVIFPDFSTRQKDNVVYFDNVFGESVKVTKTKNANRPTLVLYPNPASDFVSINSEVSFSHYDLFSISGKLIESRKELTDTSIDISDLASGLYLLKVYNDREIALRKFVKE